MYVYVMENSESVLYIGFTNDIERTINRHKLGRRRTTSKGCLDWHYLITWEVPDYITASKFKRHLKVHTQDSLLRFINKNPVFTEKLFKCVSNLRTTKTEEKHINAHL